MQYPALSKLGLEANDPTLSVDYLMNQFKNKNKPRIHILTCIK